MSRGADAHAAVSPRPAARSAEPAGEVAHGPDRAAAESPGRMTSTVSRPAGHLRTELALAVGVFAALCVAVLMVAPQPAEPDDGAYRASIVAATQGHFLTLSTAQAEALAARLNDNPAAPPNQWVQVADGRYISEKDPGYPYLAAPFQALGLIRWAPLFYGALACVGLFAGARRWLGRFGGPVAVGLYCTSGAALAFAWRDYMPTFTDASLIAAGSGALLWSVLATDVSARRRTWIGLAGFIAIELATFVRYTNVAILGCAVVAAIAAQRLRATRLPARALVPWLSSVACFGAGVLTFDDRVYGGPLATGYRPGEVSFSLAAITPNLRRMPGQLLQAMPLITLALIALIWITLRWLLLRRGATPDAVPARRDLAVGLALGASWFALWGVYSAYTWTTDPTNVTVQDVRFYVPALGALSLLGACAITRIPRRTSLGALTSIIVIAAFSALGVWAFHSMYAELGLQLS